MGGGLLTLGIFLGCLVIYLAYLNQTWKNEEEEAERQALAEADYQFKMQALKDDLIPRPHPLFQFALVYQYRESELMKELLQCICKADNKPQIILVYDYCVVWDRGATDTWDSDHCFGFQEHGYKELPPITFARMDGYTFHKTFIPQLALAEAIVGELEGEYSISSTYTKVVDYNVKPNTDWPYVHSYISEIPVYITRRLL